MKIAWTNYVFTCYYIVKLKSNCTNFYTYIYVGMVLSTWTELYL